VTAKPLDGGRVTVRLGLGILLAVVSSACMAGETAPQALLERYKCVACHRDREARTGPAFADIAARYRGDPKAPARLVAVIRSGEHGRGPWPMPPHPEVAAADAKVMVRYILSMPN
jgi:cytochrome c